MIRKLHKAKPKLEVKPKVYDRYAKLEITNDGGMAIFTAKARVIKGIVQPELYNMCWESSPDSPNCSINHRDTETIVVAEISRNSEKTDDMMTAIYRGGIALYKMSKERIGVTTLETIDEYKRKEQYPTMYTTTIMPQDKCILEVIITSDPSPLEDYGVKNYLVEIDHERGNKLAFTQLPESDAD